MHFDLLVYKEQHTYMHHEEEIMEYENGVTEMWHQRMSQQGRLLCGSIMSLDPNRLMLEEWLETTEYPVPDVLKAWVKLQLNKGEYYG
jgi:hypothetical protein